MDGDAAATARNILAHERLYRLAGVADLMTFTCDAAVALIFYELLRPVNKTLSLSAAFFRFLYVSIVVVNTLNHFAPLMLLGGLQSSNTLNTGQAQFVALLFLQFHGAGYNIGLVFFGLHCVLLGYLLAVSRFFPRVLGWLMAIAGICYVSNSLASLLLPSLQDILYPYILAPCGVAEVSLTLYLLIRGINLQRWKELVRDCAGIAFSASGAPKEERA